MDSVITTQIEAVRAAFADGASPADLQAGATACRTLLAVLESQPGQPLGTAPPPAATPLASAVAQLGRVDVDQVLDLVILKLHSMLPADAAAPTAAPQGFRPPPFKLPGGGGG